MFENIASPVCASVLCETVVPSVLFFNSKTASPRSAPPSPVSLITTFPIAGLVSGVSAKATIEEKAVN
ncbi:Uncharacterised protein [Streptococcus pneumoniae]|nr:Uncharacterised protein [Streptococcus pneumoniae]